MRRGQKAKPPRPTYSIFRSDCHLPAMERAGGNAGGPRYEPITFVLNLLCANSHSNILAHTARSLLLSPALPAVKHYAAFTASDIDHQRTRRFSHLHTRQLAAAHSPVRLPPRPWLPGARGLKPANLSTRYRLCAAEVAERMSRTFEEIRSIT